MDSLAQDTCSAVYILLLSSTQRLSIRALFGSFALRSPVLFLLRVPCGSSLGFALRVVSGAQKVQWQTPQTGESVMPSSKQTSLELGVMFVPRGEGNPSKKMVQRSPSSRHKNSWSTKVTHMPGTMTTSRNSLSLWPLKTTGHASVPSVLCLTMYRRLCSWTHLGWRHFRSQALILCGCPSSPNL